MLAVLAIAPLAATAAGYLTRSLITEYVTLSLIAVFALALYVPMINWQGQSLQRREVEVLEVVREPTDD